MRLQFKRAAYQREIEEQGFVKIPFLNSNEVQDLTAFYNAQTDSEAAGFHCTMFNPDSGLRRAVDQKVKEVFKRGLTEQIEHARMLYANFMVKEHGGESDFFVHQDWTYVDETRSSSWAVWVPLVDTDVANGALHVVPRTHQMGNRYRGPGIQDVLEGLHQSIREDFAVPVEMKAGEAIIWDHRLVHFSPANLSGTNRVAATVILVPKGETVVHCRAGNTRTGIDVFEVDTDFYMNYVIKEAPSLPVKRSLSIDSALYSRQDFESVVKNEGGKQSMLKKVINLFNG